METCNNDVSMSLRLVNLDFNIEMCSFVRLPFLPIDTNKEKVNELNTSAQAEHSKTDQFVFILCHV